MGVKIWILEKRHLPPVSLLRLWDSALPVGSEIENTKHMLQRFGGSQWQPSFPMYFPRYFLFPITERRWDCLWQASKGLFLGSLAPCLYLCPCVTSFAGGAWPVWKRWHCSEWHPPALSGWLNNHWVLGWGVSATVVSLLFVMHQLTKHPWVSPFAGLSSLWLAVCIVL